MMTSLNPIRPDSRLRPWFVYGVFGLTWVHLFAMLPEALALQGYVFYDSSWPIATDNLWADHGVIPVRDVTYFYGLLTLVVDRVWFALVGRTPEAQTVLIWIGVTLSAWGLIRIASAAQLSRFSQLILLPLSSWCVIPAFPMTPTHALEPMLLIHAIAFQATGRLRWALVLAALAVFVKPSMGGLYGLILLAQLFLGPAASGNWQSRCKELIPVSGTCLAMLALLSSLFGPQAVWQTLLPLDAGRVYEFEGYGFFNRRGSQFLFPNTPTLAHYLFTSAGLWVICTAVLLGSLRGLIRERTPASLTTTTLLLLHLCFIFLLFGNEDSWFYYPYLLGIGSVWVLDTEAKRAPESRLPQLVGSFLLLLYLIFAVPTLLVRGAIWLRSERTEATGGLFASPQEAEGWAEIRELAKTNKVYLATVVGGGAILFPELSAPRVWFLLRPIVRPTEIQATSREIDRADYLVVPRIRWVSLSAWDEFQPQMSQFALEREWPGFLLVKRVRPPESPPLGN